MGESPSGSSPSALLTPLTETGALLGTPAYMAPEQHEGEPAEARSDQFAFCVTAYEALYGERPFSGDTIGALAASVAAGRLREPPKETDVPGWVRKVLLRGLAHRKEDRFPSMEDLLRALSRDPGRMRRRVFVTLGVSAGAAVLAFAMGWARGPGAAPCPSAEGRLAGVWDAERRDVVRHRLVEVAPLFGEATARAVTGELDKRAAAWVKMHRDACEATAVRHEQSPQLLDARMACLARRLDEMGALGAVLAGADPGVAERAVQAVTALAPIEDCGDANRMLRSGRADKPEVAQWLADQRRRLAEAQALGASGKFAEAIAVVESVLALTPAEGSDTLTAEALRLRGLFETRAGKYKEAEVTLERAILAAEKAGQDEVLLAALTDMLWVVGNVFARADEGERWKERAWAVLARAENPARARQRLLMVAAGAERAKGAFEEALKLDEEALAIAQRTMDPDSLEVATALTHLAAVQRDLGRYAEARQSFERSLDLQRKILGPEHPAVGTALATLGLASLDEGRYDAAVEPLEKGIAQVERTLGADHPQLVWPVEALGRALLKLGHAARAEQLFDRARVISTKKYGARNIAVVEVMASTGEALVQQGRAKEGLAMLREAVAIGEAELGVEHARLGPILLALGHTLVGAGRHREALPILERSRRLLEPSVGRRHPDLARLLVDLGIVALAERRFGDAKVDLERALGLLGATVRHDELGDARFWLGKTLWATGETTPRVRDLVRAAREDYLAAGATRRDALRSVGAWLGKHPAR